MRADGFRDVEPEAVNLIEIGGRERRRMRAEVIRVGAPAAMVDDQPDVERLGLGGPLPRLAEQPGLLVGRERRRFADVHVRRSKPQDGRDNRVEHVVRRHDQQPHGTALALGDRDHFRQQPLFGRGRRGVGRGVFRHVEPDEPDGHDHDVAIARRLKGRMRDASASAGCARGPGRCRRARRCDRATAPPPEGDRASPGCR